MNVSEIINRPNNSSYDIDEMCFVIKEYIKEKKGEDIDINPYKRISPNNPFVMIELSNMCQLVNKMYDVAMVYFLEKERYGEASTICPGQEGESESYEC